MQHLTTEALARLVDEPPDQAEAAHLDGCPACREELQALRRQTTALAVWGQAQPADPPAEQWDAIVAGLAAGAAPDDLAPRRARWTRTPWFRVAAAIALYALGTATGLTMRARAASEGRGQTPVGRPPAVAAELNPATTSVAATATAPAGAAPASAPARATVEPPRAAEGGEANAGRLVSGEDAPPAGRLRPLAGPSGARTPEEAFRFVREAEQAYLQAYSRYTELAEPQGLDDPVARIAALESIVLTTRQALDRAPADPVINGYHLTAVAQRDAALRQAALRSNGSWF